MKSVRRETKLKVTTKRRHVLRRHALTSIESSQRVCVCVWGEECLYKLIRERTKLLFRSLLLQIFFRVTCVCVCACVFELKRRCSLSNLTSKSRTNIVPRYIFARQPFSRTSPRTRLHVRPNIPFPSASHS